MKVITIATLATTFFFTANISLHACPTAWGLNQHTCSHESIQTENTYLHDDIKNDEEEEDD